MEGWRTWNKDKKQSKQHKKINDIVAVSVFYNAAVLSRHQTVMGRALISLNAAS